MHGTSDEHGMVVVESYVEGGGRALPLGTTTTTTGSSNSHDSVCVLSAFLYLATVSTILYLAALWVKHRVHAHYMDSSMYWW